MWIIPLSIATLLFFSFYIKYPTVKFISSFKDIIYNVFNIFRIKINIKCLIVGLSVLALQILHLNYISLFLIGIISIGTYLKPSISQALFITVSNITILSVLKILFLILLTRYLGYFYIELSNQEQISFIILFITCIFEYLYNIINKIFRIYNYIKKNIIVSSVIFIFNKLFLYTLIMFFISLLLFLNIEVINKYILPLYTNSFLWTIFINTFIYDLLVWIGENSRSIINISGDGGQSSSSIGGSNPGGGNPNPGGGDPNPGGGDPNPGGGDPNLDNNSIGRSDGDRKGKRKADIMDEFEEFVILKDKERMGNKYSYSYLAVHSALFDKNIRDDFYKWSGRHVAVESNTASSILLAVSSRSSSPILRESLSNVQNRPRKYSDINWESKNLSYDELRIKYPYANLNLLKNYIDWKAQGTWAKVSTWPVTEGLFFKVQGNANYIPLNKNTYDNYTPSSSIYIENITFPNKIEYIPTKYKCRICNIFST